MKVFLAVIAASFIGCCVCSDFSVEVKISNPHAKPGEKTTISCVVNNPEKKGFFVNWERRLGKDKNSKIELGTNKVLNDQFKNTGRYTAEIDSTPDNTKATFKITITDLKVEDAGEIGCVIPEHSITVFQQLVVYENVKNITISTHAVSGASTKIYKTNGRLLEMEDGERIVMECEVTGSYPAPKVCIYLGDKHGDRNITHLFQHDTQFEGVNAPLLLQTKGTARGYKAKLRTIKPLEVDYTYNNKELKCVASLPNTTYNKTSLSVNVKLKGYKPHFLCKKRHSVKLGQPDVEIVCETSAHPGVNITDVKFYWNQMTSGNTTLYPGKRIGGYIAESYINDKNQTVMVLKIKRVYIQQFRKYFFEAENKYGAVVHEVQLIRSGFTRGALSGSESYYMAKLGGFVLTLLLALILV